MTTPSNANTSGLDYFGYRVFNAGMGACWLVAKPGLNDTNPEPLVTAASAQAAIDAQKAQADRLAKGLKEAHDQLVTIGVESTDESVRLFARGCADSARAALQQETQP